MAPGHYLSPYSLHLFTPTPHSNTRRNFTFDNVQFYTAPDGCLCDDSSPSSCAYKQGDGNPFIHDWTYEESVSCVVMQAELLLISRDFDAIRYYLPYFLRLSNFVEERRDGVSNLFAVGPAGIVSPSLLFLFVPSFDFRILFFVLTFLINSKFVGTIVCWVGTSKWPIRASLSYRT